LFLLYRFLSPEEAIKTHTQMGNQAHWFIKNVPIGVAYVLRSLWGKLGFPKVLLQGLKGRQFQSPLEGAIFAMVANRVLALDSKRAVEDRVRKDVTLENSNPISLQHLYRAKDLLLEHENDLQIQINEAKVFQRR